MTVVSLLENEFNQAGAVRSQPKPVTIEILPGNDVIYKVSDDLDFENWNFGFLVKGINDIRQIEHLKITHYSQQTQTHLVEYFGITISRFLKKQKEGEITFHNFHFKLPQVVSVDSLKLEIFSRLKSLGHKSARLIRYAQQNQYRLPVSGTWFVSSGHDFGVEHRRHLSRGHFAWDFVRINEKGRVANGPRLEANFSYGHPVVAPAAGIVIDIHKGEPDNNPGTAGHSKKANFVEIDHGHGEISRSVHLKRGSIKVSKGDSVVAGQIIAAVGNSGDSDNPHLHFGFQRNIPDSKGEFKQIPIPIQFSNYRVSWNQGMDAVVKKGRPRRGQFIRQN